MSISSAIQSLTGRGQTTLAKVIIQHQEETSAFTGRITALFNPRHLQYSKDIAWKIDPITGQTALAGYHQILFTSSNPRTLTIDLFFDTYEGEPDVSGTGTSALQQALATVKPINPFNQTPSGVNVGDYTKLVAALGTVLPDLHRPPLCKLTWGDQTLIQGVLTHLTEDFTMFLVDGTPVRATLSCTFTEAVDPDNAAEISELQSADVIKQRVFRRGDTLSSISQEVYSDATQWRVIADANAIDNPRDLDALIGRSLIIPRLMGNS
jgi:hypothetical protein